MDSKVAVVKTNPSRVFEDIYKIMKNADIERALDKKKPVILKDNISWHFPFLSANTTPWQLEGVILALKEMGFDNLVCVENNTVVTNTRKGEQLNKYTGILKKYNVPVLFNFNRNHMKWIVYSPKAKMRVLNRIYPEGIRIPDFFIGKNIIHLPTVKCHIYTTTTGSMKNAFGGLLNKKRHYTHSVIHETLCDLLDIQKEIHTGIFTVMDGTVCGNGPGPRTMIPVEKDYMLASADCVAIDAVAAKMMGFAPMEIKYIKIAHVSGLGCGDITRIKIIGEDISNVNFGFHVGDNLASHVGDFLWFGPLKKFQKIFFHTPLVYLFVFGSFFYHDYIWWPFIGKRVMQTFKSNSKWGKLFDSYK